MRRHGAAIILALAFAQSIARADPTPNEIQAARELFSKAEKDEDAGQWSDALEKLRRALSVKATPGLHFHIALCEEKLGQLVAALADYTAADQSAREQNNKDVADAVAEPLRTLRIRVPTLTIDVPPAMNALVELDGKAIAAGLYGIAMPVEPGLHQVRARANGKHAFTTQVQLKEREAQTTTVKWIDLPTVPTEPASDAHEAPPPKDTASSGGVNGAAIVATISAGVLLGFGIGAYMAADGNQSNLIAQCPALTSCDDLRTQVRAWDAVALGSWIAAAGVAVVAIVLWAKPSHASGTSARIEMRPGGFAFAGSF